MVAINNKLTSRSIVPGGVWFTGRTVDAEAREYLFELARESGLGEMFVATSRPLPRGTVVTLEYTDRTGTFVTAKGIVSWRRGWMGERGMQVMLTESSGGYRAERAAANRAEMLEHAA
jgi:hypothetical protein